MRAGRPRWRRGVDGIPIALAVLATGLALAVTAQSTALKAPGGHPPTGVAMLEVARHKAHGNTSTTAIDPSHVRPRVATYRNGYGTHFECSTMCYFIALAHLACIAALLAVFAVVPVYTQIPAEQAPFLPWLGNDPDDDAKPSELVVVQRRRGVLSRLASVFSPGTVLIVNQQQPKAPPPEPEHDVDIVTEPVPPVRTFEDVAVETDESLLPTVTITTTETDAQGEKKLGIFASPPPAPETIGSETSLLIEASTAASARRASAASPVQSRRGTLAPQEAKENILTAVERKSSIQKRAEKRKEYVTADINHANLAEHEQQMYEYLEFVRELLEGVTVKKVCQKSAKVVKRTFFITPELDLIYWNAVGNKQWIVKKSSMEAATISKVLKGIDGNPHLAGKGRADKSDLYVSIVAEDGKELNLETKDAAMRQRFFHGFSRLSREKREEKTRKKETMVTGDSIVPSPMESAPPSAQPPGAPSTLERERQGKTEEDDPKRWRASADNDDQERADDDEDGANQSDE